MSAIQADQLIAPFRWAKNKLTKTTLETDLRRARVFAKLLDTQFKLGGVRFGLEGLLGLVPVAGDAVGVIAGLYPIWIAHHHKLGKGVQAKMAANLVIEFTGGLVPWVGDFFDVAFKANVRNVKLLEKAVAECADRDLQE